MGQCRPELHRGDVIEIHMPVSLLIDSLEIKEPPRFSFPDSFSYIPKTTTYPVSEGELSGAPRASYVQVHLENIRVTELSLNKGLQMPDGAMSVLGAISSNSYVDSIMTHGPQITAEAHPSRGAATPAPRLTPRASFPSPKAEGHASLAAPDPPLYFRVVRV